MQPNHHQRRAVAGSSRRLDQHGAAVETGVLLALTANARKTFAQLLHELEPGSQSTLAAALVSLSSDGWILRSEHTGRYVLSARGLDMIKAASQKRGGQTQRRAA
jgi:DNA-binding HxlR family transcriptional regulator